MRATSLLVFGYYVLPPLNKGFIVIIIITLLFRVSKIAGIR